MMKRNLVNDTALKILMVSSEYELLSLKKETLALIKKEVCALVVVFYLKLSPKKGFFPHTI